MRLMHSYFTNTVLKPLKLVLPAPENSHLVGAPNDPVGDQLLSRFPGEGTPILAPSILLPTVRNGEENICDMLFQYVFRRHTNISTLDNQLGMII